MCRAPDAPDIVAAGAESVAGVSLDADVNHTRLAVQHDDKMPDVVVVMVFAVMAAFHGEDQAVSVFFGLTSDEDLHIWQPDGPGGPAGPVRPQPSQS